MGRLRTHHLQGWKLGKELHRNEGRGGGICTKDRMPHRERRKSDGQGWIEREGRKQVFVPIYLFQRKLPKRREVPAKSIPYQIQIHYFQLLKKMFIAFLYRVANGLEFIFQR